MRLVVVAVSLAALGWATPAASQTLEQLLWGMRPPDTRPSVQDARPNPSPEDSPWCWRNNEAGMAAGCTALIDSKLYRGPVLAALYWARAYAYSGEGKIDAAVNDMRAAEKLDPGSQFKGALDGFDGKDAAALERFEATLGEEIKKKPREAALLRKRAYVYQWRRKIDAGLADAAQAVTLEPRNAANTRIRGALLFRKGEDADALAELTKALTAEPNNRMILLERAIVQATAASMPDERQKFAADFDKAIALTPDRDGKIELLTFRAHTWTGVPSSGFTSAVFDYREVLKLDTTNAEARRALAKLGGIAVMTPDGENCVKNQDGATRMAACTKLIDSRTLQGPELAAVYFQRGRTRPEAGSNLTEKYENEKLALADLDRALAIMPDLHELLYVHALRSVAVGDDAAARRDYDKMVATRPLNGYAHFLRHQFLLSVIDRAGARAALDNAIRLEPINAAYAIANKQFDENLTAHRIKNIVECTTNTHTTPLPVTIQNCTRSIEGSEAREQVRSRLLRGLAYAKLEQYDKALEDFAGVLRVDPNHLEAIELRAGINQMQKNYTASLEDHKNWIRLKPQSDEPLASRGNLYITMGLAKEAEADFRRALQLNPKSEKAKKGIELAKTPLATNLGLCDVGTDRAKQIAECGRVIGTAGESKDRVTRAHLQRAFAFRELNKVPEAIADFDKAVAIGGTGQAYALRGNFYAARSIDDNNAMADLDKAIALNAAIKMTHYWRAVILKTRKDLPGALAALGKELEVNQDADVYFERAEILIATGAMDRAEPDIQQIVKLNRLGAAELLRGYVADKTSQPQAALRHYSEALRLEPNHKDANVMRGRIAALSGTQLPK